MSIVEKSKQNTPCFSGDVMTGLAGWKKPRERVLFILCGSAGLGIGEVLSIEIDKHIASDFSLLKIRQKARHCKIEERLKTQSALRDEDLHPAILKLLKEYVGERQSGFLYFAERTAALAHGVLNQGPVSAVSCVGVGSGSMRWSEEELQQLEVGVVGAFARGCHDAGIAQFCLLSAAGSTARSRFRYVRVMGMKEDTVRNIGFIRLAIFRPGIIVGNAHTPAWVGLLGSLVPGPIGNIDQRILGRSIAAEIALHSREAGEVIRGNTAMRKLAT